MELELSALEPVALGGEKWIYQHPGADDLLVKVWRKKHFDSIPRKHPILVKFMRMPRYSMLLHEITEHIAIREQEKDTRFLQTITGIVDTDLGPGLVVVPVRTKDGQLARTLHQLIKESRFKEQHAQELERLFNWMVNTDVVIRDFTINNMVWDEIHNHFVIIDGIGSKPTISLRPLCRCYNKHANKKRIAKLRQRLSKTIERYKSES